MANIRFLIRNLDADEPQTVYVSCRFGRNDKLMYALPVKVAPIFWDASRSRVKATRYCPDRDEINDTLNILAEKLNHHITDVVRNGGEISRDSLRDFLDVHFGKRKDKADNFHDFFRAFIESNKTRMNGRRGGQVVTKKTRYEYTRTLYYIEEYERRHKRRLDFDDIDQDFLASFVGFLQSLDLATNTIAHKVICLKTLMRAAVERELTRNERWRFYRNSSEETEAIALDEDELQRIHDIDLSRNKPLERVRDLFLVGCWTGLRFSDVTRIREENIEGGFITMVQSKTNAPVVIPVHPVFEEMWVKYRGKLPTDISNQKFNVHIKEVCKAVGLTDGVLKSITKGGRKVTTRYEKWQLVSSHTARRSFATNLYRSGFPSISIMQITGHKTETAFLKYIKVSKQEHARLLAQHWLKHGR